MKNRTALIRSISAITVFCLIFTASVFMPVTGQAYAVSEQEEVYDPYANDDYYWDDEGELLRGTEVPVSKTYQAIIQYNISTGGTKYKGSGECWGYANKVKGIFGGGGSTRYVKKKSTKKNIYNALKNVRPGTHVRFGNSKSGSGNHSIAVYKVTKDKIYFSDANWGYHNDIHHYAMSLEAFANYHAYNYIMWYIQPRGGYKTSSIKVVTAAYDEENKVDVAWKPVSGARSYTVYRASSKSGTYKKLKTVKSPLFTDNSPNIGTNYYKVKPSNRSMSSPKQAFNKLVIPTVRTRMTKQGYTEVTWDKITGAKKYCVYKTNYDDNGKKKYERIKTINGTSFTFKDMESCEIAIRALASNKKANSGYNSFYAYRAAPQPKIINGGLDENGTYVVNVRIPYDLSDFDYITVDLMRSDSKNGEYKTVGTAYAYSKSEVKNEDDYYYNEYQYNKNTFDPETSVINIKDEDCKAETTYYYKAVARANWSEGLDSEIVKLTVPERPVVEVNYGNGILYRYLGGDPIKYVYDGVTYKKNLHLTYWGDDLYYEDDKGQGYVVDTDGYMYYATYNKEYDYPEYGDYIGNNTYDEDSYDDTDYYYDESDDDTEW